jgi:small subunit ribosomal protein S5
VLAKSLGSSNAINVSRATLQGLKSLRRPEAMAKLRGKSPEEVTPKKLLDAYRERERAGKHEITEVA